MESKSGVGCKNEMIAVVWAAFSLHSCGASRFQPVFSEGLTFIFNDVRCGFRGCRLKAWGVKACGVKLWGLKGGGGCPSRGKVQDTCANAAGGARGRREMGSGEWRGRRAARRKSCQSGGCAFGRQPQFQLFAGGVQERVEVK